MPLPNPQTRARTIALLAASIPAVPEAARLRAGMAEDTLDWEDVLYLADGHGITPLLFTLWKELGVFQAVPAAAQQRMAQAYRDNATRNADARREFGELTARMRDAGVETIVIKGLPLLDRLYPDPAGRVLYDLDLLARSEAEARRGYEALRAAGYTPVPTAAGAQVHKHLPSVWRENGFVRRGYLFDVAQPRPVEMHVALWDTPWRGLDLLPLPDLWAYRGEVPNPAGATAEPKTVGVLAPEDTTIHLCVHLATHLVEREARVGQAIDLARLLARDHRTLDWDRLCVSAGAARVSRFVYLALRAVHTLTGAPLPPDPVLRRLRAATPAALARWVEREGANDLLAMDFRKTDLSQAYALTLAATRSWHEKANVLRFALFPPMENLQAEYGGRGPWLYARHLQGRGRVYLASLRQRRAEEQ